MSSQRVRCPDDVTFIAGFDHIRNQQEVPASFPAPVLAEANAAAERGPRPGTRVDARDLPVVTIDPPGSRDLDQAFSAQRRGDGYRVHYAIADVGAFVDAGGALDAECRRRGVTLYAPDTNTPLHPHALSEGVASLLPGVERAALLWTIDLDERGEIASARIERAVVRSRELLTYQQAQERIDAGHHHELQLLREIGQLREQLEIERGAVSLNLPSQEVVQTPTGFDLVYDTTLPVEGWNAQISLLTGIAAGHLMVDAGVGLLRTLPRPDADTIAGIRRTARALEIDWADDVSYADRVRSLDPNEPRDAALLGQAARALRGAGYVGFTGTVPADREHSAIASVYSHVTAPLRRVCDRISNEILVALSTDAEPPSWAVEALEDLPAIMNDARQRDRDLERAVVDFVEAVILQHRVGDDFPAVVTGRTRNHHRIQLRDPAIVATLDGPVELGDEIQARLVEANPAARRVRFGVAPGAGSDD